MTSLHTVIFLGLVVWGSCLTVPTLPDEGQAPSTGVPVTQQAERRMTIDMDDEELLGDSNGGKSSYSSVVIHHPVKASHTGHQPTSKWTIQDHKPTGFHRSIQVEPTERETNQPSRRHHKHYSRSGALASPEHRAEVTERPEPLSTAQTFFRLRGYNKGKASAHRDEDSNSQDDGSPRYDEDVSSGAQYGHGSPHGRDQSLPPGMTHDLMNVLLSQQPQTFDYGYKAPARSDDSHGGTLEPRPTARPSRKPQKKYKTQVQTEAPEKPKKRAHSKNRDSFNVGYSIGFGSPTASTVTENPSVYETPNDVVLGKPKSHRTKSNYKLHVNGENSVWKEIHPGVEMSEERLRKNPLSLTIPEKSPYFQSDPEVGVISGHPGQNLYYLNGAQQDYNAPTTGQATFDHAHALDHSNTFDFSNAVSHPLSPVLSPQSKQDPPSSLRSKGIQPGHYSKPNQQSFHSSFSQKSGAPYSDYDFSYRPFSLDKQSDESKDANGYSESPKHPLLKPAKIQPPITTTSLSGGFDMSHFMGFGTPVPIQNVFIPGKKDGEGQMVPAIVIPISQLNGFESFGPGLNYLSETSDNFKGFGGDVFNVVPPSVPKEAHRAPSKFSPAKPHTPRIHENKSSRGAKGAYLSGVVNLSPPQHLDPRPPRAKPHRSDPQRPFASASNRILAPKFVPPSNFRESPINLKRSPSSRNARLAQLQSELNTILAEEMYKKNRPNRRNVPPLPLIRVH